MIYPDKDKYAIETAIGRVEKKSEYLNETLGRKEWSRGIKEWTYEIDVLSNIGKWLLTDLFFDVQRQHCDIETRHNKCKWIKLSHTNSCFDIL